MKVRCDTFHPRPGYIPRRPTAYCAWCMGPLTAHRYLDTTVYSTAGPFVGPGGETRIPNPRFQEEAA